MSTAEADDRAYLADHVDRLNLQLGEQVGGSGAMGKVYPVVGGEHYYKEYIDPVKHARRLELLIAWRNKLPPASRSDLDARCAWPLIAVTRNGEIVGFLMKPAPARFWTEMEGERHTLELQHLIHKKSMRTLGISEPSLHQRLELIKHIAETMDFLGWHGMVYGDISEKNVLWSLQGQPGTYLIDCDNARPASLTAEVAGVAMPRNDNWRDPDLADGELPDEYSDRYTLAVFCYRVFYESDRLIEHEQSRVLLPENKPRIPELERLLMDGLGVPKYRPSGRKWSAAIAGVVLPAEPAPPKVTVESVVIGPAEQTRTWPSQPPTRRPSSRTSAPAVRTSAGLADRWRQLIRTIDVPPTHLAIGVLLAIAFIILLILVI